MKKFIEWTLVLVCLASIPYAIIWNYVWHMRIGNSTMFSMLVATTFFILQIALAVCAIIKVRQVLSFRSLDDIIFGKDAEKLFDDLKNPKPPSSALVESMRRLLNKEEHPELDPMVEELRKPIEDGKVIVSESTPKK